MKGAQYVSILLISPGGMPACKTHLYSDGKDDQAFIPQRGHSYDRDCSGSRYDFFIYEETMVEDLKSLLKEKGFLSFEGFSFDQPEVNKESCWTFR